MGEEGDGTLFAHARLSIPEEVASLTWDQIEKSAISGTTSEVMRLHCPSCAGQMRLSYQEGVPGTPGCGGYGSLIARCMKCLKALNVDGIRASFKTLFGC